MMVEQEKLAKQTIAFYKKTFESTFAALDMIQEQTQRMLKMQMDLMTGMPEEGKKVLNDWMKVYKKGCEEFKSAVDDKFKQVESYFSEKSSKK
jgi:predicted enzyme related to lactoylglutathione lyase